MRSRWLLVVASCACGLAGLGASPALADNTWRIESSGTLQSLYAVSFVDYNQGLAVGSKATVVKSGDGRTQWTVVRQPRTPTRGCSACRSSTTTTAGRSAAEARWLRLPTAASPGPTRTRGRLNSSTRVLVIDASHGWAVGADGTIVATADGGTTWSAETSGTTQWLEGVSFADASHGWAVGYNGTILATSNGGATWSAQSSGTPCTPLYGVQFVGTYFGVAVGAGGTIVTTYDGGTTWTKRTSGTTNSLAAVTFADNHLWTVGHGGTILVSTDFGATWSAQSSPTGDDLYGVSFLDSQHGSAVGFSGRLVSYDSPSTGSLASPADGAAGSAVGVNSVPRTQPARRRRPCTSATAHAQP